MAEEPTNPADRADAESSASRPARGWSNAWQFPLIVAGAALIVLGVSSLIQRAPGPDFEGVLSDARALIEQQKPAEALAVLNGPIVDEIGKPGAAESAVLARFHVLRAEALFLANRERRPDMAEERARTNNERALQEFKEAEHLDHGVITERHRGFIAETTLDLGELEKALPLILGLGDSEADRRRRLLKSVAEAGLEGSPAARQRSQEVLEALRGDAGLSEADRVWTLSREMRLAQGRGEHERVIDTLLPELQRLNRLDTPDAAELHLLLGESYMEQGSKESARTHFTQVETLLPPGDARRGIADAGLARLAQARGDFEEARDRFASVVERFPGTQAQLLAYLGLGEVEADLGRPDESLAAYTALVTQLEETGHTGRLQSGETEQSLSQRYRVRVAAGDLESALVYAQLAVRAFPAGEAPAPALLRLAETQRDLAGKMLGGLPEEGEAVSRLSGLDPELVERARRALEASGEAYERHAHASMVRNPEEASSSLWNAADAFDRAGDQREAIRLFTEFMQNRKQDPKQLEAKYRLGRCFMALNDYTTAIAMLEGVVQGNAGSDEAFRAYVPLAQSYLLASSDGQAAQAERLLLQVLDGRLFEPDAPQFKRALVELGQMYLRLGRFAEAIGRLEEAIERFPESAERTRLLFDLADANRLSASAIRQQLGDAMPISERSELEAIRDDRLRRATVLFEEVRERLDGSDPTRLTPLQKIMLRNAIVYRGDCAFDLGNYEEAIRQYDSAAQRLVGDPASLVPMVQIVNCYAALGRLPEARTAHERARARLKDMPEEAWQGANVPMSRAHWERWLESSLRLDQLEGKTSTALANP